jgi:hypothetical protein
MQSQIMLPSLQEVHLCKEFILVNWPPSLATIQLLAFQGNWPSMLYKHSSKGKVNYINLHLKGLVKLKEH